MPELTDRERQIFEATQQGMGARTLASQYGISRGNVRKTLKRCADKGYVIDVPYKLAVAEGMKLQRFTAQQDKDGNVVQTWSKPVASAEQLEEFVTGLEERVRGKCPKVAKPKSTRDYLHEVIIGDPHAGMYAWSKETGEDYDLDIYARLHTRAMHYLIDNAGTAKHGIIAILGDLFHADNKQGMTEHSRNILDMDGRFGKIIDAVRDTTIEIIQLMAENCGTVDVVLVPGNHDPRSVSFMQRILSAYFTKTNRITVHIFENNRHYLSYGNNLLAYYHGDRIKADRLQSLMAQEAAQMWSATKHRHWRCGHIHQTKKLVPAWETEEAPGVDVEYFRVLAGLEAYAAEAGYSAKRSMSLVVHDETHGEVVRYTAMPEMFCKRS